MNLKLSSLSLALITAFFVPQISFAEMIGATKGDILVDDGVIVSTGNFGVYSMKGYTAKVIDDVIDITANVEGIKSSNEGSKVILGSADTESVTITVNYPKFTRFDIASIYSEKGGLSSVESEKVYLNASTSSNYAAYGISVNEGTAEVGTANTELIYINSQGNSKPAEGTNAEGSGILAY